MVAAQSERRVSAIVVTGNSRVSSATIRSWMETKEGGSFLPSDSARIAAGFSSEGFLFAAVDSVRLIPMADSSTVTAVISVHEGKRAFVASVKMEGLKSLEQVDAERLIETQIGTKFVPAILERDVSRLLDSYEQSGFPFAKIEIRDIRFEELKDSVATFLTLAIAEGALAKIRDLRIEGNTTTKTSVITREARLVEGEVLRGGHPMLVKQRLEHMQLFSSVSMPELFVNQDGTVGLLVKVTEGNPNRFDGVVGYVPSGSTGTGGYLTGLVDVQFRNILGTARKLTARWYRETESSQEIELRYREPWIASLPLNGEAGFAQRKQDSTFIRNEYRFSGELMATDELNLGVVFSSERVLPTEGFGVLVASKSHTTSVGVSVSYDSRNDPVTPSSGLRYRTEYQTGVKETQNSLSSSSDHASTQKLAFDLEYDISPVQNQVLSVSLSARNFSSGAVEQSDLFRLGGSNTLRGYREGQFLGSRVAWSNAEYRLLTGPRSYAFGFIDIGYILMPDRAQAGLVQQETNKIGYGAGIRLDTPLGLMGVSLAFGEGDTFSTAKLHIRLINEF
ncbi:MAG: BamA/TamA family outer membrane protein [Ignavibacteriales bacterium]|nr:BamA/TamA family outer membrane protein [Ignavibacteriales bacterium]